MKNGGLFLLVLFTFLCSCSSNNNETNPDAPDTDTNTISGLEFIDEFVIPSQDIEGVPFGGLSGIDYHNNKWYLLSDASTPPIRFYEAAITYSQQGFTNVGISKMTEIKNADGISFETGMVDPEALRFDTTTNTLLYTSEGSIVNGIDPDLIEITTAGEQIKSFALPDNFSANTTDNTTGPRHNGALEGLSISHDKQGYWIAFELPLVEDGPEPGLTDTDSPVRITYINKTTGMAEKQFAYELDPVARPPALGTDFTVNGLVEILEYDTDQFLVLERSFSSGYLDGGNSVKIYKVDASGASNTLDIASLSGANIVKAEKTLLFDFETIRSQLTNTMVDNLEGITFGPTFEDGSRAILVVADNNFSSFFTQLNQLILFKVIP